MYDPYGPEQTSNNISFGSVVKEALNPITLLQYQYSMNPNVWSNKKGIWSPFETRGAVWKKTFSESFSKQTLSYNISTRTPDKFKYIYKKGGTKKLFNLINPFGKHRTQSVSERIVAAKSKISSNRDYIDDLIKQKQNIISKMHFEESKINARAEQSILGSAARFYNKLDKKIGSSVLKKERNIITGKMTKAKTTIKEASRELNKLKWMKWGIRGAKAGSVIGLTLMAFDIAQAVAEPLASAVVGAAGRFAEAYNTRFMPDMGGKLQLSYLSQGAATERQRAIQAMSKAYINGRSAFGSEAQMYHQ